MKTLVDEISIGSQEQARGIEQIAKTIAQMEQVTQKTAASAEQGASAGEELSAHSNSLHEGAERLILLVGANGDEAAARPARRALPSRAVENWRPDSTGSRTLRQAAGSAVAAAPKIVRESFPLEEQFKEF